MESELLSLEQLHSFCGLFPYSFSPLESNIRSKQITIAPVEFVGSSTFSFRTGSWCHSIRMISSLACPELNSEVICQNESINHAITSHRAQNEFTWVLVNFSLSDEEVPCQRLSCHCILDDVDLGKLNSVFAKVMHAIWPLHCRVLRTARALYACFLTSMRWIV